MSYFEHDSSEISKMAKIGWLKSFRINQDLLRFHKVINDLVNSPELLSKITFEYLEDIFDPISMRLTYLFEIYNLNKI